MKRLFFTGFLVLTLARVVLGQSPVFINNGTINSPPSLPPQIDATNFINNGQINIGFNNYSNVSVVLAKVAFLNSSIQPFEFSDVLNYTNRGTLTCDTGFVFDTEPSSFGFPHMAASFGNANIGTISSGSAISSFLSTFVFFAGPGLSFLTGVPNLQVSATNVVNAGTMNVGLNGFITVDGMNVNLNRGTLHVEGFDDFLITSGIFGQLGFGNFFNLGIFNNYWGVGKQTNVLSRFNFGASPGFAQSPFSTVTFASGGQGLAIVTPPNSVAFANTNLIGTSNFTYQVVFINTNVGIATDVRFEPASGFAIPVIQWLSVINNNLGAPMATNTLYLSDAFGAFTNLQLFTNGYAISGVPLPAPFNYAFNLTFPGYTNIPQGNIPYLTNNIFGPSAFPETNEYSAYSVSIQPVTTEPDPTTPGSSIPNIPGRIEINAGKVLDLTLANITGPNYMNLSSTNHFVGSAGASIKVPYMDINLGTTNGIMRITNLVSQSLARFNGTVDMYSARWTNVVQGVTNGYHVLIVDSELSPTAFPLILNFTARSTNTVISDSLNIASNLLINAQSLTITSNGPTAPTPFGQINLFSPEIFWSSSLPTLQTLTNWGIITTSNTTYFLGVREPPYYTSTFDQPYQAFVNHGAITTSGNTTWATYYENTGFGTVVVPATNNVSVTNIPSITSTFGPISVQANTAVMADSQFIAPAGDISIMAGSLSISNHELLTSGALTLYVTNVLNFATNGSGAVWTNFWVDGNGFNLPIKPPTGDLLGTTVSSFCPGNNAQVANIWAGQDLGLSVAGFTNNAAVGHLILDGADTTSSFFFTGASIGNAIYVDQIELRDGATNITNPSIGYTAFAVDTNMMIYFADAVAGNQDISERLDGGAGGRLRWISAYAGLFSGTNITLNGTNYPLVNRALATSKDIDSNGSGTNNYFQLQNGNFPLYTAANVNFTVAMTNHLGAKSMLISWQALAYSTNFLRYKTNLASSNWLPLTNFIQGPVNSRVTVKDPMQANGRRFYKVEIDPQQPY